ncbi:MAG: phage tail tape measure protein [Methanobrevibacter sp.]|nr:phage tail tape measure protein [Methanobrevibacter sp.]
MASQNEFYFELDDLFKQLHNNGNLPDIDNPASVNTIAKGRNKNDAQVQLLRQAAMEAYRAGITAENKLKIAQSQARSQGYDLLVRKSPRGDNEFEITALPSVEKDKLRGQADIDLKELNRWPTFIWSGVDKTSGLSSRYGQKTINLGRLNYDFEKQALAFYTGVDRLGDEIIRRFTGHSDVFGRPRSSGAPRSNTRFVNYLQKARTSTGNEQIIAQRHVKSSIANAERQINAMFNASNSYQSNDAWQILNAEGGSHRSTAIHKSFISVEDLLQQTQNEIYDSALKAFHKANPSYSLSRERFSARLQEDLTNIYVRYFQNRTVEEIEQELTTAAKVDNWDAGYLWKNQTIQKLLHNVGTELNKLGLDIGLTSENAIAHRMVSALRHGDLSAHGSLGDKAGRKPDQVAKGRARTDAARKALDQLMNNKNPAIVKKNLFTGWEVANDLNKDVEDLAQYSFMFATAEEFEKAQEKAIKELMSVKHLSEEQARRAVGWGSGGSDGAMWYNGADDIKNSLNSVQLRSKSISREIFASYEKRLRDDLMGSKTRQARFSLMKRYSALNSNELTSLEGFIKKFSGQDSEFFTDLEKQDPQLFDAVMTSFRHQAAKEVLEQQFGINARTIADLDDVDIMDRDPNGKPQVTIKWSEKHLMKPGEKILGAESHMFKGRANEVAEMQLVLQHLFEGRGLGKSEAARKAKEISFVMEPENLTARNVDAFLDSFIHTISGVLRSPKAIQQGGNLEDEFFNTINTTLEDGLTPWLTKQGDQWVINADRFAHLSGGGDDERLEKEVINYVGSIKNALVGLATKTVDAELKQDLNDLSDAFKIGDAIDKNTGEIVKDSKGNPIKQLQYDFLKFRGTTAMAQHQAYDYGEPGGPVLNADYRIVDAIDRAIKSSTISSQSRSKGNTATFSRALLGERTRDYHIGTGLYDWNLALDDKGRVIFGGQFGGSNQSKEDYEQFQRSIKAVEDVEEWMNKEGASWNPLDWARSAATGNGDIILGFGDLKTFLREHNIPINDPTSLAVLENRYVDISGLNQDSFINDPEFQNGVLTEEAYKKGWGIIADRMERNPHGRLLFVPANSAHGLSAISGNKQITTGAIALPSIAALGGKDKVFEKVDTFDAQGNAVSGYNVSEIYQILSPLISRSHDLHYAKTDKYWTSTVEQEEARLEEDMIKAIGEMDRLVRSKEGSINDRGNKPSIYHSMIGKATAPIANADMVDTEWGELANVATRIGASDAEKMLHKQNDEQSWEDYANQLETQYRYLYGELIGDHATDVRLKAWFDNIKKASPATYTDEQIYKEYAKKLRDSVLASVTRGTTQFDIRQKLALSTGKTFRGLFGGGIRFPESNGEGFRFNDIFVDKALTNGEVRAALGSGFGQNLDWDGDTYGLVINMLSAKNEDERKEILATARDLGDYERNVATIQTKAFQKKHAEELKNGVSIQDIVRNESKEISAIQSRLNKSFTGRFSNEYQNVAQILERLLPKSDENVPLDELGRKDLFASQVTRAVFEGFTQDAISSKKITEEFEKRFGKAWGSSSKFITYMQDLYALIKNKNTYANEETIKELLTKASEIGIFSNEEGKDFFNGRINSQLIGKLQQYSDDELKQMAQDFGEKNPDDFLNWVRDPFNPDNKYIGFDLDRVAKIMAYTNKRTQEHGFGNLGQIMQKATNRPNSVDATVRGPVKTVGTDIQKNTKEIEKIRKNNPDLAEKAETVGALVDQNKDIIKSSDKATKSINQYGKAINDLYEAMKKSPDAKETFVSSMLTSAMGSHFKSREDQKAFEERVLKAYEGDPSAFTKEGISGLAGYGSKDFNSLKGSWVAAWRGKVADATEQVLTYLAQHQERLGIKFDENFTFDDIFKIAQRDPALAAMLYEYKEEQDQQGLGLLIGRADDTMYGVDDPRAAIVLKNALMLRAMHGAENIGDVTKGEFGDTIKNEMWQGVRLFDVLQTLAGDDPGNILAEEMGIVGAKAEGTGWYKGRADTIIHGYTDKGERTLDIYDKKTTGDVTKLDLKSETLLRYAGQLALYRNGLEQMREYILDPKNNISTIGQLRADKDFYQDQWVKRGGEEISEEMFNILKDRNQKIRTRLAFMDRAGNFRGFDVFSDFLDESTRTELTKYLTLGTKEEFWDENVKRAILKGIIENNFGMRMGAPDDEEQDFNVGGGYGGISGGPKSNFGGILPMLGKQFTGWIGRFFSGMGMYKLLNKMLQGVSNLVKEATQLDKTLTDLQVVTGGTRKSTRQLISDYSELGRKIGATTQEVASAALSWQRQGYDAAEVTDLVTSSIYLSKLGMLDAASATQALTSSLKGFKMQASESMDVVDKLTALDLKAATSAGEIASGLAQFANIGSLSGVNIDEAAAYVATIADVTQMSGSSAGQALKTIISRYGNVKAGAYDKLTLEADTENGTKLNDVERVLSKLGINMRDSNLSFKDFSAILTEIAGRWQSLDNVSKKAIAGAFAGIRQQEAFVTLMENWDKYEDLLETSRNSKGTAEKKYNAIQESLQASQAKFQTTWEQLANNAEISEILKVLTDIGTWIGKMAPYVIKYLPSIIISQQQLRGLNGESWIGKGLQWLDKKNLLGANGLHQLFFGTPKNVSKEELAQIRAGKGTWLQKARAGLGRFGTVLREGADQALGASAEDIKIRKSFKEAEELGKKKGEAEKAYDEWSKSDKGKEYLDLQEKIADAERKVKKAQEGIDKAKQGIDIRDDSKIAVIDIPSVEAEFDAAKKANEKNLKDAQLALIDFKNNNQGIDIEERRLLDAQAQAGQELENHLQDAAKYGNDIQNSMRDSANSAEEAARSAQETSQKPLSSNPNVKPDATKPGTSTSSKKSGGSGAPVQGTSTKDEGSAAKMQAASAMITYAVGQLTNAITTYQTSGLTHTYNGETVNSSENARNRARGWSTAIAAILPGAVGSLVGNWVANEITKSVDKARDDANKTTEDALKRLNVLRGTSSTLDTMIHLKDATSAQDVATRDAARDEYLATLYSKENEAVRDLLETQLKTITSNQEDGTKTLRQLTIQLYSEDRQSRAQAAHMLEYAQKQSEYYEKQQSRANDNYNRSERLHEAYLKYNQSQEGYSRKYGITKEAENAAVGTSIGTGLGTSGAVFGGSALVGSLAAGAAGASSIPVAGWIIAAILGLAAGGVAAYAAYQGSVAKAETEAELAKQQAEWESLSIDDKILSLGDQEKDFYEKIETTLDSDLRGDLEDQLQATRGLKETLIEIRDEIRQEQDEDNQAKVEKALAIAGITNGGEYITSKDQISDAKYFLSDLNIAQARAKGPYELYKMLADALGDDNLSGYNIYTENGEFSQYFVKMARKTMGGSSDVLESVLSGKTYTLNEAVNELSTKTDQFSKEILQNFAQAMRVGQDELKNYTDLLGTLTLADLMKTTGELEQDFDSLSGVLGSVADSTQSVVKWMTQITQQYPELISYMSDTPKLISELVRKMKDLNNQTMRAQFEEYGESGKFWDQTILPGIHGYFDSKYGEDNPERAEHLKKFVEDLGVISMSELIRELNVIPSLNPNSDLAKDYNDVLQALSASAGASGVRLGSDLWIEQTQKLTAFIAEQYRAQISALEEQKQALQDVNKQRQFENDLLNARSKLSDALNNKRRIYRSGVGFVYEANQSDIRKAKEELEEVQLQKDVSKITKQIEILQNEAVRWENYWAVKSQELQEQVFKELWGENLANLKDALFGSTSQALSLGANGVVNVHTDTNVSGLLTASGWSDAFKEQTAKIFGLSENNNFANGGIWSSIFGSNGQLKTWYDSTLGTSVESLLHYVNDILAEIQKKDPALTALENSYRVYERLLRKQIAGEDVSKEEWNTAITDYGKKFQEAKDKGLINESWDFNTNKRNEVSAGNLPLQTTLPWALGLNWSSYLKTLESSSGPKELEATYDKELTWLGSQIFGGDNYSPGVFKLKVGSASEQLISEDTGLSSVQKYLKMSEEDALAKKDVWMWINGNSSPIYKGVNANIRRSFNDATNWDTVAQLLQANGVTDPILIWTRENNQGTTGTNLISLVGGKAYSVSSTWGDKREGGKYTPKLFVSDVTFAPGTAPDSATVSNTSTASNTSNNRTLKAVGERLRAIQANATGTLDFIDNQNVLLNELGTEAIITPQGTITALPSHTGIVPADITKNLWQLGEIAPSILRVAEMYSPGGTLVGKTPSSVTDQSFNINNLSMNVTADDSFDVDAFVAEIKSRVALTRNTRR